MFFCKRKKMAVLFWTFGTIDKRQRKKSSGHAHAKAQPVAANSWSTIHLVVVQKLRHLSDTWDAETRTTVSSTCSVPRQQRLGPHPRSLFGFSPPPHSPLLLLLPSSASTPTPRHRPVRIDDDGDLQRRIRLLGRAAPAPAPPPRGSQSQRQRAAPQCALPHRGRRRLRHLGGRRERRGVVPGHVEEGGGAGAEVGGARAPASGGAPHQPRRRGGRASCARGPRGGRAAADGAVRGDAAGAAGGARPRAAPPGHRPRRGRARRRTRRAQGAASRLAAGPALDAAAGGGDGQGGIGGRGRRC